MHYVGQTVTTAFWFFVFWYGGWYLLWSYQQVSMPPYTGWWDWALPAAAIFAVSERFSVDLEAQETSAGAHRFSGPYGRQAAIGAIFGLVLLAIAVEAELMQWLPDPFENEILATGMALGGALTLVIIAAGRRRDYPLLSAIYDLAAGVIAGATASWFVLSIRPNIAVDRFTGIGVCAGIGGALNLWRGSAPGGKLARFLTDMAARSKTMIVGSWWAIVGGLILWFTWHNPFESYTSGTARNAALFFGSAIGSYLAFARGLGSVVGALRLSHPAINTEGPGPAATASDLRQAGLVPCALDAIYLGRFLDNRGERDTVGYAGAGHLVTIGPAGSGKGAGLIIPNLSTLRRSIVIIDPNGEAAAITARKRAQFGPVAIINPFGLFVNELPHLKSHGFNPLAALDPDHDDFGDDCTGIARALVREQEQDDGAILSSSAQDLVAALIMHEKFERREHASLANVRAMLTEPFTSTTETGPIGLLKTVIKMTTSKCAALRSKTGRFLRERHSSKDFISIAIKETRFLDSPQIQRDLQGTGIDWDKLKHEVTTVYVILPADRLDTHANYLRLVIDSALRVLLRSQPGEALPPVLFILDEFAHLGYLPPIASTTGIADGTGVQLWPFLQDLNQLKTVYQDRWQTLLGNAAVFTAFAPRDPATAQYLSARSGSKTVIVETRSEHAEGTEATPGGDPGAPSFKREHTTAMPERQMLCLVEPVKNAFMSRAPGYWNTNFNEDLDPNPYHQA
ncbi:MAG TPA: type IV secretory system conjugative DNA transfer family protein [Xanthobacteraceae bacterium]|nr:type IV secretory system conjugative DNA transfer family protein [Xanthobacteraceae bacterium]